MTARSGLSEGLIPVPGLNNVWGLIPKGGKLNTYALFTHPYHNVMHAKPWQTNETFYISPEDMSLPLTGVS